MRAYKSLIDLLNVPAVASVMMGGLIRRLLNRLSSLVLLCLLQAVLLAPGAAALTTVCGFDDNDGIFPEIFTKTIYEPFEASFGNAILHESILLQPALIPAADVFSLGSGSVGHYMSVIPGINYEFEGVGTIGWSFFSEFTPNFSSIPCEDGGTLSPPSNVFVDISPAMVFEGEMVTISWGSQNADECLFEGTPIGPSGSTLFAAALSDGRTYAIDCFNLWGSVGASAVLTVNPLVPTVDISTPSLLTLTDPYSLSAAIQPASVTASNYQFEIRWSSSGTWHTLGNGASSVFSGFATVAGTFQVRVTATVNGFQVPSQEKLMTVQFPSFNQIVADSLVQSATDAAWESIKNATTPSSRREEGFWIRLNTQSRQYEVTAPPVIGPVVSNDETATITLGTKPADSILSPTPLDTPTYTVASFHGHTPYTYLPLDVSRDIGPSEEDEGADLADDVVGVVYDYIETVTGTGSVWGGHPIDHPAMLYHSGPARRSTP